MAAKTSTAKVDAVPKAAPAHKASENAAAPPNKPVQAAGFDPHPASSKPPASKPIAAKPTSAKLGPSTPPPGPATLKVAATPPGGTAGKGDAPTPPNTPPAADKPAAVNPLTLGSTAKAVSDVLAAPQDGLTKAVGWFKGAVESGKAAVGRGVDALPSWAMGDRAKSDARAGVAALGGLLKGTADTVQGIGWLASLPVSPKEMSELGAGVTAVTNVVQSGQTGAVVSGAIGSVKDHFAQAERQGRGKEAFADAVGQGASWLLPVGPIVDAVRLPGAAAKLGAEATQLDRAAPALAEHIPPAGSSSKPIVLDVIPHDPPPTRQPALVGGPQPRTLTGAGTLPARPINVGLDQATMERTVVGDMGRKPTDGQLADRNAPVVNQDNSTGGRTHEPEDSDARSNDTPHGAGSSLENQQFFRPGSTNRGLPHEFQRQIKPSSLQPTEPGRAPFLVDPPSSRSSITRYGLGQTPRRLERPDRFILRDEDRDALRDAFLDGPKASRNLLDRLLPVRLEDIPFGSQVMDDLDEAVSDIANKYSNPWKSDKLFNSIYLAHRARGVPGKNEFLIPLVQSLYEIKVHPHNFVANRFRYAALRKSLDERFSTLAGMTGVYPIQLEDAGQKAIISLKQRMLQINCLPSPGSRASREIDASFDRFVSTLRKD